MNVDLQKVELNTSIFLEHFPCACLKNESFPMDRFLQKWPVAPTSEKCYVIKTNRRNNLNVLHLIVLVLYYKNTVCSNKSACKAQY